MHLYSNSLIVTGHVGGDVNAAIIRRKNLTVVDTGAANPEEVQDQMASGVENKVFFVARINRQKRRIRCFFTQLVRFFKRQRSVKVAVAIGPVFQPVVMACRVDTVIKYRQNNKDTQKMNHYFFKVDFNLM